MRAMVGSTKTKSTVCDINLEGLGILGLTIRLSGMLSAAASVGLSCLWDMEEGLGKIDKYTYSGEEYIKVRFHDDGPLIPSRSNQFIPLFHREVLCSLLVFYTPA